MATSVSCPSCGSETTRKLTSKEFRARSGQDNFVVVMPRKCSACGHVFDPPLSPGVCYLVSAIAAAGLLAGCVLLMASGWVLVRGEFSSPGPGGLAMGGVALIGIGGTAALKYFRLARDASPAGSKPASTSTAD
jgi:hypothetical protein